MTSLRVSIDVCVGFLFFVLSSAIAQTALPPHCVCPTARPGSPHGEKSESAHGATTKSPHGDPHAPAGRHEREAPEHQAGGAHKAMPTPYKMMLCTNTPKNYSNPCEFVNAQASNNKLGMRPCSTTPPPHSAEGHHSGGDSKPKGVCFTDNHSETTEEAATKYLQAHRDVGIRCNTSCPCKLACPPKMEEHHMQTHQGKMADDEGDRMDHNEAHGGSEAHSGKEAHGGNGDDQEDSDEEEEK